MENDNRRRALKFFVTACVISAMYYFVMENIMPSVEVDGGSRVVMGTFARIVAVAKNEGKAKRSIKAGFDELTRIAKLMSEEPNKVNHEAFGGPVKVSPELFEVLRISVDYSKLSQGAFDITVCDSNGHGGYEKLVLDSGNQTVRFAAEGFRLDLGGIGKGYAVDKAVEIMKRRGAIGGLVDSGGNIRCFGRPAHKGNWLIGIQEPNFTDSPQRPLRTQRDNEVNAANGPGMVLKLRDMAVATKLGGVTIIAPKALVAEVIASAVSVLGAEKGLDLVDSLLGVEAIIITQEGKIIKSNGVDNYINR